MKNSSERRKPGSSKSRHDLYGLVLPASVLKSLQKRGIYCTPGISLEHQHLAKRYVLRAVESGGAVSDMGRACAFVAENGTPLPWLQSLNSIAVNGRHAIFLAESMVRLEILRSVRNCELAITLHTMSQVPGRKRPEIASKLLFRGRDGILPFDAGSKERRGLQGKVTPIFYDHGGSLLCRLQTHACRNTPSYQGLNRMSDPIRVPVTVGEPNWTPLELAVPACEVDDFMYMGQAGEIELYKHRITRRYLNLGRNSNKFYQYLDEQYVEVTQTAALEHVRG
jgi:hypothetical protein